MTDRPLRDLQSEPDSRNIEITKVGVKGLSYPIVVQDRAKGTQHTIARIQMSVLLPHHFRGTHMSRFIEILNHYRGYISADNIQEILAEMRKRLDADLAHIEMEFPYFIEKQAPVSKARGLQEYTCRFIASEGASPRDSDFILVVNVPVTTLCPCSKEISEQGAHNQRSIVSIRLRYKEFIWIEDLITVAEESASSALYPLLKRRDEKYVTEYAYNNPRFVEDVVREVGLRLEQNEAVTWYRVEAENFESIHNHSAYAMIEREKSNRDC